MVEFEGWCGWPASVRLLWGPGDTNYHRPQYDPEKAKYTPEEENERMNQEVTESDGFDIDFSYYRCVFNYHNAKHYTGKFVGEPHTNEELLKRLAQNSLDDYNKEHETKFEFVKFEKANFHFSAFRFMFLITFEAVDPYDGLIKPFQARVRHLEVDSITEYFFCRPKPNQGVEYYGTAKTDHDVEKVIKKQRVE